MNNTQEKRAIDLFDLMTKISVAFDDICIEHKHYTHYVHRIFYDGSMIVKDYEAQKHYRLLWSIDDSEEITIVPENIEEWEEVEETWQPTEMSLSPELRTFLNEKKPIEITSKEMEQRTRTISRNTETKITGQERRTFSGEVRAKDKKKIVGYAAVFNTPTELLRGQLIEEIAPTAFDNVLGDDVRALFNHSPDMVLGRSAAGTLKISTDDIGLRYEIEVPNTTLGRDLMESITRGDITQSSFGFTVESDEYETLDNGLTKRTITRCGQLFDVSPVTFPAYETTEATARSVEHVKQTQEHKEEKSNNYLTPIWQKYRNLAKKRV